MLPLATGFLSLAAQQNKAFEKLKNDARASEGKEEQDKLVPLQGDAVDVSFQQWKKLDPQYQDAIKSSRQCVTATKTLDEAKSCIGTTRDIAMRWFDAQSRFHSEVMAKFQKALSDTKQEVALVKETGKRDKTEISSIRAQLDLYKAQINQLDKDIESVPSRDTKVQEALHRQKKQYDLLVSSSETQVKNSKTAEELMQEAESQATELKYTYEDLITDRQRRISDVTTEKMVIASLLNALTSEAEMRFQAIEAKRKRPLKP
jgi:septal ring factor EnvC (AmiA/AmiB activator)